MSGIGRLVVAMVLAGALTAGLMLPYALGLGLAANKITDTLADVESEDFQLPPPERTVLQFHQGTQTLAFTYLYTQNRASIPLSKVNERIKLAVLATEDRRFKTHKGVDWPGTIRALLRNSQNGSTQGGSTITQQYVKNYLFLVKAKTAAQKAAATEQTPIRKLREAKLALQLNNKYSKDEVLERFLNLVAFGPSTYGVEAASQRYFGVSAENVSLGQAAMLAAMINNPNKFNPLTPRVNEKTGKEYPTERRDFVLDQMVISKAISKQVAEQAKTVPVSSLLHPRLAPNGCFDQNMREVRTYGYYCQYVLDYLRNHEFTNDDLATGGYKILTNLDADAMTAAKEAVDNNADPSEKQANRVANVMAVVQPGQSTRSVVALVANRPWGNKAAEGQTAQRLTTTFAPLGAGSTFKIFTAAAALQLGEGVNWIHQVKKETTSPLSPGHKFKNSTDYPAQMTLRDALMTSPNTPFIELQDNIGLEKVVDMSVKLGLRGYSLDAGDVAPQFTGAGQSFAAEVLRQKIASYTLGVTPTSPLELANVGATLASKGTWCPPSPIDSIHDRNGVLKNWKQEACQEAVPEGLATTLANAMKQDILNEQGTAHKAAAAVNWTREAAGKTGTTQDYKSSAFLGFTPQYSGAVLTWDYLPRPKPICVNPLRQCDIATAGAGQGMGGGTVPAATWMSAMTVLHQKIEPQPFGPDDPTYLDGKDSTSIPPVLNVPVDVATAKLEAAGFKVSTKSSSEYSVARNIVADQSPKDRALPGTTIVLTVSTGGNG